MNFSQQSFSSHEFRRGRSRAPESNVFRRLRLTLAEAVRAYNVELVCRALTIEPAARERLTLDVHFCDLR